MCMPFCCDDCIYFNILTLGRFTSVQYLVLVYSTDNYAGIKVMFYVYLPQNICPI